MLLRFLFVAILVAVAAPAALGLQSPPPPLGKTSTLTKIEAIGGQAPWLTIVAPVESLAFAMPIAPAVSTVKELDGTVSIIYQCQSDRAILQVCVATLPDIAVRQRRGLSAELYARLGFETLLVGVRSEAPNASVRFVRSVTQDGMEGGDGVIVTSTLTFPYYVRVLRADDDKMLIIGAIAVDEAADREDVDRFMSSVSRWSKSGAPSSLKPGTRESVEVSGKDVVASEDPLPELAWEQIAPEGSGYSVYMPPIVDSATTDQLAKRTKHQVGGEKYIALSKQVVLILMVVPNEGAKRTSPRVGIEQAMRGFASGLTGYGLVGARNFEREVSVGGVRGAQGRITIGEGGGYAVLRSFETKTRLYMLAAIVLYPQSDDNEAIERFFDSFALTK